ncbi:Pentatricopeptide repeat-containing protein [Striga hermonthica]|uniref:Pentatricopeptide repeat-containing protein n=1 Tax=Striga hermonthica TaxID=68872 RepID=A0A9N7N3F6_STRHE|nr:Pentatricopeptide repeat-containing protein [Striga hermonthica]
MLRKLIKAKQRGLSSLILGEGCGFTFSQLNRYDKPPCKHFFKNLSTVSAQLEKIYSKGPTRWILLEKLENALKEHQVNGALKAYNDFKRLYGYPDRSHVSNLITELSYTSDSRYLQKACDLVLSISKEKPVLLTPALMTKVALSLARAQIPVSASNVLRQMLEKKKLPSLDVLRMIFLHLVKTENGVYLGSNMLDEIFHKLNTEKSASTAELTRPDSTIFNLVLDACVRFKAPLKGHLVMELMALNGVMGDAHTAVIVARLHEMNFLRDELKKFKDYVDIVPKNLIRHYQQFYDCLLSLHFKLNDIESASGLLQDLCKYSESNDFSMDRVEKEKKSCSVSIGSGNIKMGLRLQFLPQQLNEFFYDLNRKQEFISCRNGRLALRNKGLAKLVIGYKRSGEISGLSKLLINIEKMLCLQENSSSLCSDVVEACVYMGWLEMAHDILEDLELEKYCARESSYLSLLTAYYDKKMPREAKRLLSQMRRVGINFSEYEYERESSNSSVTSLCKSDLANSIIQNMQEGGEEKSSRVREFNSSIYFFTKARMIEDAVQTYRKMQKMKIEPDDSTFFHLVCGYISLGLYRQITFLWGDIKRSMGNLNKVYSRDLYELLLLSFIQGGYFERVMEVISLMVENNMFLDKGSYKNEFLKFHMDLYRSLTSSDAKDEVQRRRIEQVRAFRNSEPYSETHGDLELFVLLKKRLMRKLERVGGGGPPNHPPDSPCSIQREGKSRAERSGVLHNLRNETFASTSASPPAAPRSISSSAASPPRILSTDFNLSDFLTLTRSFTEISSEFGSMSDLS